MAGVISSTQQLINNTVTNASGVHAADLDNDGDLDVLSGSINNNRIAWYENLKKDVGQSFGEGNHVSTSADQAYSVYSADLNNDGKMDIISGSAGDNKVAWYQNNGDKTFSTEKVITTQAINLRSVHAADLNNDGHIDVLSASVGDNKIAWYQNNGDGTISTTQQIISNSVLVAHAVHPVDIDLDGDMDVLSVGYASGAATYWHENQGNGVFAAKKDIGITSVSASVHAVDLDNDGDKDVVSASMANNNVVWFRNDRGSFSAPQTIDTLASGFISSADIDNDGDADLVLGGGNPALGTGTTIVWYKNDGEGHFVLADTITSTAQGVRAVYAIDLDKDGDADVLTATAGGIVGWYENIQGVINKEQKKISTAVTNASSIHAADLDNDGDMDVISASIDKDKIEWYENQVNSVVTHGNIPLSNVESIKDLSLVSKFLTALPVNLVQSKEETVTDSEGTKRLIVTGTVSVDIPIPGAQPITLHGGELLVLAETPKGATAPAKDAIFIKYRLHDFINSLVSNPDLSVIPNVEMLLAYSKNNLDETAIKDLPQSMQDYFQGIFSEKFGIPVFNSLGSLNVFLPIGLNQFPDYVSKPLAEAGITEEFLKNDLGIDGSIIASLAVNNVDYILPLVTRFFPGVGNNDANLSLDAGIEFQSGVVLPAASLPGWLTGGIGKTPLFQAINFEPDASVQFRQFVTIKGDIDLTNILDSGIKFSQTMEAALRVRMPNLLNADSFKDKPGTTPLDVRTTLERGITVSAGEVSVNGSGKLHLVNDWVNPFGIPGISMGNTLFTLSASVGVDPTQVAAAVGIEVGFGGTFSCLDNQDKPMGTPRKIAGSLGADLKVNAAGIPYVQPTSFGFLGSLPNLTLQQNLKCSVGTHTGVLLGFADSVIPLMPADSRDAFRAAINNSNGNIKSFINEAIEKPLEFPPVAMVMDQVRINNAELAIAYKASVGDYLDGIGMKVSGGAQYRENRQTEDWKDVGSFALEGSLNGGKSELAIGDFDFIPNLSLSNNKMKFEVKPFPPTADWEISGKNKFFGYESDVDVKLGLNHGINVKIDSQLDDIAGLVLNLETLTQDLSQFTDPDFKLLDFKGNAEISYNPNKIVVGVHAAVSSVTQGAQTVYRNALKDLESKKADEASIQRYIDTLEVDRQKRLDKINATLEPLYNSALSELQNSSNSIWYHEDEAARWWKKFNNTPWNWFKDRGVAWANHIWHKGQAIALRRGHGLLDGVMKLAKSQYDKASKFIKDNLDPEINFNKGKLELAKGFRITAEKFITGLQAANNVISNINDNVKDASSIKIHKLSGTLDSLVDFYARKKPLSVAADLELPVVNMRCTNNFDVYDGRVDQLVQGVTSTFTECINNETKRVSKRMLQQREQAIAANQAFVAANQPLENDEPANAIVINGALPLSVEGHNIGATVAEREFVDQYQEASAWWQWQPDVSGIYELSVSGFSDTAMHIHQDNGSDLVAKESLLVADTRLIDPAKITYHFDSASNYYIAITSQFDEPTTFALNIKSVSSNEPPVNDHFENATVINGEVGHVTGNNLLATTQEGEAANDGLPVHHSLWWQFTAIETGVYTFDSYGSEFDTVLRAYRSDSADLAEARWVKTADDMVGDSRASLSVRLLAGETIKLSVASKDRALGDVELQWYYEELTEDQWLGDHFSDAIVLDISSSDEKVSAFGATNEIGEPLHAGITNNASVWFALTPVETKTYVIHTSSDYDDTVLALYRGNAIDSLELLAANDDMSEIEVGARIQHLLEAGNTYYIAVASKEGSENEVNLYYGLGVANDNFIDRILLTGESGTFDAELAAATLEDNEPLYEDMLFDSIEEDFLSFLDSIDPDELTEEELEDLISFLNEFTLDGLKEDLLTKSLWWSYTATEDGVLEIDSLSSNVDTALIVFEGTEIDSLEIVDWNDDTSESLSSQLRLFVNAGTTYQIAVTSREAATASMNWRFLNAEQLNVANDASQDASLLAEEGLSIGSSGTANANNTYAESAIEDEFEPLFSEQSNKRLWWKLEPTDKGYITLDTAGTKLDTVIEVYEVNQKGQPILLTSNDNYEQDSGASRVRFAVKRDVTYLVAVDSLNDATGDIVLNYKFESSVADVLVNDVFSQAIVLNGNVVDQVLSNHHAQYQTGEPSIETTTRPNSIWYQWRAPESGLLKVSSESAAVDTLLGLYQGNALRNLTQVGSNDNQDAATSNSGIVAVVEKDVLYYIALATVNDVQSDAITLRLSLQSIAANPAANASIENSEVLDNASNTLSLTLTHSSVATETGAILVKGNSRQATSRWYQWQAPEDGEYTFDIKESTTFPELEIYLGESEESIILLATSHGIGSVFGEAVFSAKAGQRFYIRVTSGFEYQGEVRLNYVKTGEYRSPEFVKDVGSTGTIQPAKIIQAGKYSWTWKASDDGLVGAFIAPVKSTAHSFKVYKVSEDQDQTETLVVSENADIQDPSLGETIGYSFTAEKGQQYRVEVVANSAIYGDAWFLLSYMNAIQNGLDTDALTSNIGEIKTLIVSLLAHRFDEFLDAWLVEEEMLPLLHAIIADEEITEDDLYFEIEVTEENAETVVDGLAKVEQVRVLVYNWFTDEVLLAIDIDPYMNQSDERESHKQMTVGNGFQNFDFKHDGSETDSRVEIEITNDAFKEGVSSVFASVSRKLLTDFTDVVRTPEFQLNSLYDIELNLFSSDSVRYDLSEGKGAEIVNGIKVRIPVDASSLLAWLNSPNLTTEQATTALNQALAEGRLKIVSAEDVSELLNGKTTDLASSQSAQINIEQGYVEFTTTHFSSFMLVSEKSASVATQDTGRGGFGCTLGGNTDTLDPVFYLLFLIALLGINRQRIKRMVRY